MSCLFRPPRQGDETSAVEFGDETSGNSSGKAKEQPIGVDHLHRMSERRSGFSGLPAARRASSTSGTFLTVVFFSQGSSDSSRQVSDADHIISEQKQVPSFVCFLDCLVSLFFILIFPRAQTIAELRRHLKRLEVGTRSRANIHHNVAKC